MVYICPCDLPVSLIGAAIPAYWYALAAVLVITPLYFLLTRPRKKRSDSKWKG